MKHMKKMLALALVVMSVPAIAIPATAASRPWRDRWGRSTLFPGTYPEAGSEMREWLERIRLYTNSRLI